PASKAAPRWLRRSRAPETATSRPAWYNPSRESCDPLRPDRPARKKPRSHRRLCPHPILFYLSVDRGSFRHHLFLSELVLLDRQHAFHLRDRNHWQKTRKDQKQRQEQAYGAGERAHIDVSGMEVTPGTRQKIARQTGGDNYEALEPHSN